jgi:hypothetical protein
MKAAMAVAAVGAIVCATLAAPTMAVAQGAGERVLLTGGVVKHVDVGSKTIVLDNGRKLRPRAILLNDEIVDITSIQPKDSITLSGIDLGFEEVRAGAPRR